MRISTLAMGLALLTMPFATVNAQRGGGGAACAA